MTTIRADDITSKNLGMLFTVTWPDETGITGVLRSVRHSGVVSVNSPGRVVLDVHALGMSIDLRLPGDTQVEFLND